MPAPTTKISSHLPELLAFAERLKDAPYPTLLTAPAEAGWGVFTQEIEAVGQPDGTTLVRFAVSIGRDGKFEYFDTVSVKTGAGPGPVSIAARMLLPQTLVHRFFGRLPDAPVAEQKLDVSKQPDGDIILPGENPLPPEPEGGEYVEESASINRRDKIMPNLVDHFEPDGVPVFIDLDDLPSQFTDGQIIAQMLVDIDKAAVKFDSPTQLLALFDKNAPAIGVRDSFLADLGTVEDRTKLKELLDKHQARLEAAAAPAREVRIPGGKGSAEAAAPRRRRVA